MLQFYSRTLSYDIAENDYLLIHVDSTRLPEKNKENLKTIEVLASHRESSCSLFTSHYEIFVGEINFSPKWGCSRVMQFCILNPLSIFWYPFIPHSQLYTLQSSLSILQSAFFNLQLYSRGWSLTSKKPFFFIKVFPLHSFIEIYQYIISFHDIKYLLPDMNMSYRWFILTGA